MARVRQTSQTVTGGRRTRDACFLLCAGETMTPQDLDYSGPLDAPVFIPAGSVVGHACTCMVCRVGAVLALQRPTQSTTERP